MLSARSVYDSAYAIVEFGICILFDGGRCWDH